VGKIPEALEDSLMADPRFGEAIRLFNAGEWYACHDGFEELWHETAGPMRPVLQGILQLAVGQLHLERGNRRGATILTGEGLGRLTSAPDEALGLDLDALRHSARLWLVALQQDRPVEGLAPLRLQAGAGSDRDL
jgi:predicted metal-dependent hydrolase